MQLPVIRTLTGNIIKLIHEHNINLFELNSSPPVADWIVAYVKDNFEEFAQIDKPN